MGVRRGEEAKRAFAPAWKLGLGTEYFWRTWSRYLNSD